MPRAAEAGGIARGAGEVSGPRLYLDGENRYDIATVLPMDTALSLPDQGNVNQATSRPVADQIQAFAEGRKTGVLHIFHNDATGKIFLLNGEVVDAVFGGRRGVQAAIEMIALPSPPTAFTLDEGTRYRTIQMSYVELLLNAARYRDAGAPAATERRGAENVQRGPLLGLRFWLRGEEHVYRFEKSGIRIGRDKENDLVILEPSVSRSHARVERYDFGVMLHDLDSANGTYLAGHRIKDAVLQAGDDIHLGQVPAKFLLDECVEVTPTRPGTTMVLGRSGAPLPTERVSGQETAPLEDVSLDIHFPIIPAAPVRPITRDG